MAAVPQSVPASCAQKPPTSHQIQQKTLKGLEVKNENITLVEKSIKLKVIKKILTTKKNDWVLARVKNVLTFEDRKLSDEVNCKNATRKTEPDQPPVVRSRNESKNKSDNSATKATRLIKTAKNKQYFFYKKN